MKTLFNKRAEIEAKKLIFKIASEKEHLLHLMHYNYGS